MDVTEASLRSVAEKLKPLTSQLSDEERELLNVIFSNALAYELEDVAGMSMNVGGGLGGGPSAPPVKVSSGSPTSSPGSGSGGTPGQSNSNTIKTYPSGSAAPSLKLF